MNSKRIVSLLLMLVLIVSFVLPLASCGGNCTHVDSNGDGKCDKCNKVVTINCTQHIDANKDNKCDNCGTDIASPGNSNYTINVKTLGGMPLSGVSVYVYNPDGTMSVRPKPTDDKGNATFTLPTKTGYTIFLDGVPEGYKVNDDTNRYPMGPTGSQITLTSAPVQNDGLKNKFSLGDVMYDFTISDTKGTSYTLSELLETKRMVMLNFWYTDCSACNKEFPTLNDSYAKYSDVLEVLEINDYGNDSLNDVIKFPTTGQYEDDNLLMPFFKITNQDSLTIDKFEVVGATMTGYPTSIIIDRYGVICMIEQGAIVGEGKWDKIFDYFTADKYTQKLIVKAEDLTPPELPDVPWVGSEDIAENFSGTGLGATYREDDAEYSWPFIPEIKDGVTLVKPSNNTDNSYGILYADIQLKPGQAVMFDYFSSCEYSNDRMVIIVDGDDICSLTGVNLGSITNPSDWEQCCAYVDPRPITESNKDDLVTYEVAFVYLKDTEISEGDDTVYLKNLRVIGVDEITTETYIIRDAVSDPTPDMAGYNVYVDYMLGKDNYYHVKITNEDGTVTEGPLLLANFLAYTNFDSYQTVSQRLTTTEEIMVNGVNKYTTWMVYANASSNSAMYGYTPVTEELKEILDAYCYQYRNEAGKLNNENLWLQLCTYYDAYGYDKNGNPTKPIENPIAGLTTVSAYEITFDATVDTTTTYEVTYDRVIMPRGYLFKFVPTVSGVYRFTSKADIEMVGWIFTGSSAEWMSLNGDRTVLVDFEAKERYCPELNIPTENGFVRDQNNVSLAVYMEKDETYYIDIAYNDIYAVGTFDVEVKYHGENFNPFVMASPGPTTFIEGAEGEITGLIAIGIEYAFKTDADGVTYAYHVIEKDENGEVTKWGEKLYADFYNTTIPFPSQSLVEILELGAFDFSKTEYDQSAILHLKNIRKAAKELWIEAGTGREAIWTATHDAILPLLQAGASTDAYSDSDVAIAEEALALGVFEFKKAWGITAIGTEEDWKENDMDSALRGTYSQNAAIRAIQEEVIAAIDESWNKLYKMDDVAKGIYHGEGTDYTERAEYYISLMINDPENHPELQGCVAVTEELALILSDLFSKYVFDDVQHDFLKFCYYYRQ